MTIINFTTRVYGAKYTGSNSAEMISLFTDHAAQDACTVTVKSSAGNVLRLQHTPQGGPNEDLCFVNTGRWVCVANAQPMTYDTTDADLALLVRADNDMMGDMGMSGPRLMVAKAVTVPAAANLTPATRTIAVTWPTPLPSASYDVDICPDATLSVATPYAFAIASSPAQTATGCTLTYTNAATLLSLAAGTVDLFARK